MVQCSCRVGSMCTPRCHQENTFSFYLNFLSAFDCSSISFLLVILSTVSPWPYLPFCHFLFPPAPSHPGARPRQGDGDQQRREHPLPAQQHRQRRARPDEPRHSVAGGEPLEQGHHPLQPQCLLPQPAEPEPDRLHDHYSRRWGLTPQRPVCMLQLLFSCKMMRSLLKALPHGTSPVKLSFSHWCKI